MLTGLLQMIGRCLAAGPEWPSRLLARVGGGLLYLLLARRRRITLSNLAHAFPERGPAWQARIARRSFERMVETALFTLASPYLSERQIRERFSMAPGVAELLETNRGRGVGAAVAVPHLALWEALSLVPALLPDRGLVFGTVYRPHKSPAIEAWIQRSRQRHGLKLFSKKAGLLAAARFVGEGGLLGVLIDQNAGEHGALDLFLGRVASCTTLQGIITQRLSGQAHFAWPRRTGFWRACVHWEALDCGSDEPAVTRAANRRLERLLIEDEEACACWLWSHNRWRCQDAPERLLRLEARRSYLPDPGPSFPRRTRVLVVLAAEPDAVPAWNALVPGIRASRPDFFLTVIFPGAGDATVVADATLPSSVLRSPGALRVRWFDLALVLDPPRGIPRRLRRSGIRLRVGVVRDAADARDLTGVAEPRASEGLAARWLEVLRSFGLP